MNKQFESYDVDALELYCSEQVLNVVDDSHLAPDRCYNDEDMAETKQRLKNGKQIYQDGYEIVYGHRYDKTLHPIAAESDLQALAKIALGTSWKHAGHIANSEAIRLIFIVKREDIPRAHRLGFGTSISALRQTKLLNR